MQEKTLIFISDKSKYFFPYVNRKDIDIEEIWKWKIKNRNTILIRIFRKLRIATGFFFADWKNRITEYNRIIIFDGNYDKLLVYFLEKKNRKAKKVIFCWNTKKRLKHVFGAPYEIFSFDQNDCVSCGFKFASTLYSDQVKLESQELCYDVLFVGVTKERKDEIFRIYKILDNINISKKFHVVGEKEEINALITKEKISYEEYLDLVAKSRALLDICNPDQQGLSLRVMEALFFNKKLITNNTSVKQFDFYCENNILVIDAFTTGSIIKDFLNMQYKPIESLIKNKYEISNWVKQFR